MISQSPPIQFLLPFSESTGAATTSESMRLLWTVFRWWFLSRQRLTFRWLFVSQQGLWALRNPRFNFEISFVDDFGDGSGLVFIEFFYLTRGWARWRIHASCNSPAQLAIYCPLWALPPSRFCSWWREPTSEPDAPKRVWQVGNQHS
jgi:hypothetical protein